MSNNLTLADFTKVASKIGFTDQEISRLFETPDIYAVSTPSEDQKSTFDKVLSLSAICGEGWLDGSHKFKLEAEFEKQSVRQIVTETKDGLERYIVAVENAAGGPLPLRN